MYRARSHGFQKKKNTQLEKNQLNLPVLQALSHVSSITEFHISITRYHDMERTRALRLSFAWSKIIILSPGRPWPSNGLLRRSVSRQNSLLQSWLGNTLLRRRVFRRLSRVTEHPLDDVPDHVFGPFRVPERYGSHCLSRR
jgi:hypothetical protein